MATTGMCNSAKAEMMQGAHLFNAQVVDSAAVWSSGLPQVAVSVTTAGISSGMFCTIGSFPTALTALVATVDSTSQVTLSKAPTFSSLGGQASFTADQFYMLLIGAAPAMNYDPTQTNVGTPGSGTPSTVNVGTDEVVGVGYNSGGSHITLNTTPTLNGTTAVTTWTNNPSWTSATFATVAGIVYNQSGAHLGVSSGPTRGRTLGIADFGGTQTVAAGTFTLLLPAFPASAIVQIT